MAVKTITITTEAYVSLKAMKDTKESFSKAIIRITKKRPLKYFFGTLSGESGKNLEENIRELRKSRSKLHKAEVEKIIKRLEA